MSETKYQLVLTESQLNVIRYLFNADNSELSVLEMQFEQHSLRCLGKQ